MSRSELARLAAIALALSVVLVVVEIALAKLLVLFW